MRKRVWSLAVAALIICALVGFSVYGQRQRTPPSLPPTTWEYKVVYVPGVRNMSEQTMNQLGSQGWELVTFQAINNEGGTIGAGNYFFKRARPAQ